VKAFKILIVPVAILAVAICSLVPAPRADDQQEISDLEHKVATTLNPDEVMKYWANSDDILLFDFMGPPREFVGRKAVHDHAAAFSGWTNPKVDFLEFKVTSDGKLALARSVQHASIVDANGKTLEMTFRATDIWQKQNGQWKLIAVHDSVPVDLKTGKAEMASKM
jgi:ketosteroid isomerase-like protein